MNAKQIVGKGMIRKCQYTVAVSSTCAFITLAGYGLKGLDQHELKYPLAGGTIDQRDARVVADKMVVLERRVSDLARTATALGINKQSGVSRLVKATVPAKASAVKLTKKV